VPKKIAALKGQSMKPSTRDGINSRFHDVKGKVQEKEKAGQFANSPDCLGRRPAEEIAAKVQRGVAKTAEMHGEFAPDLGKE
jgi:hypothetical protein